ncbi:MAG: hypothetical protein A3H45_13215 [Ignavibacteria bacterium RIFCSPLOWO2_02_FULL_55_14]|nr:MAG: hypothetical protein A2X68_04695 [Ignavibacteria bacterium GWC2_56_12]OGU73027.1 MAG: hypothetical protein A3H45_13215 [Ignavibacteria bacterium RIFCSPLOWO2_02_FULL_55_14]
MNNRIANLTRHAFILIVVHACTVVGQEISIRDFRIPTSVSRRLTAGLSLTSTAQAYRDAFEPGAYPVTHNDVEDSELSSSAALLYGFQEFDESQTTMLDVDLRASRDARNRDRIRDSVNSKYETIYDNVQGIVIGGKEWYVEPDAWFVRGVFTGDGRYNWYGEENSSSEWAPSSSSRFTKIRDYHTSVGVGAGMGKIRDGLHVFSAVRIVRQLEDAGVLVRTLEGEEILRISDIMARRTEYSRLFERSDKYVVRDIVDVLSDIGAIRNGSVDAFEAVRLAEIVHEGILPRLTGWKAWLMVFHRSYQARLEQGSSSSPGVTNYRRGKSEYVEARGEFGLPLSLSSHLYARIGGRIQTHDGGKNYDWEFLGRYSYEDGNFLEIFAELSVRRNDQLEDPERVSWYFSRFTEERLSTGGTIFLEDRLFLTVNGSVWLQQQRPTVSMPFLVKSNRTYSSLDIGLNFRIF